MSEIRKTRLRERGQLTLPANIRRDLRLRDGDSLDVAVDDGRIVLTPSRRGVVAAVDAIGAALKAAGIPEEEFQRDLRRARRDLSAGRSARRKSA